MSIYKSGRPNKYNPTLGLGKKPPSKAGEYRIRDAVGSLIYIGEACNLARRMGEHIRSGKLPTGLAGGTIEWKVADGRSTSRTRRNTNETKLHSIPPCSTDHGVVKEDPQENDPAGLFSWEYFNLLSSNCIIFKLRTHICLC